MENEIKKEILSRMKILKFTNQMLDDFKNNNELYICNLGGSTEKISTNEKYIVEKLEKKYNVKVYYLIKNESITHYVYLNKNKEEWKREKQDLRSGYAQVIKLETEKGILGMLIDETTNRITRVINVK